jgi:hypothetical protein
MVGLVLNMCFTALLDAPSAYAQESSVDIVTVQRTLEGVKAGALAPANKDDNGLGQQQSEIFESLFGQPLQGAGSFYDLDAYPDQGGLHWATNVENGIAVALEATAVVPMDFDGVDLASLGLTPDEIELWNKSTPQGNLVIGYLISDIGNAAFVGVGASWAPVDGVQHPPMLTVLGTVEGFFGADRFPEDFASGQPRPAGEVIESAQVAQGVSCPDGRVVAPDAQYNTCMGNAQITFEHCLIAVAIAVAECMVKVAIVQLARMLGCKRLVLPWLIKGCLAVLAAWLIVQAALCAATGISGVANCLNNKIRDQRICANELCGRTPVVNPGPVTPVQPGAKVEQQLEEQHIQGALNIANQ